MITYFDKNRDMHLGDDARLFDFNLDAIARAVIKFAEDGKRRRRVKRLAARGAR